MDFTRLRYFLTVARMLNLTRAAELLRISPSALSKAIKILESETGRQLLIQDGRGIVLTEQGKELAEKAQVILSAVDEISRPPSTSTENLTFRIAAYCEFSTYFMIWFAKNYAPELELEMWELTPGAIEDALVAKQIDAAITTAPMPHDELEYILLGGFASGAYAVKGKFDEVPFDQIPFVVPVSTLNAGPHSVDSLDGWPEAKFPRFKKYRASLIETGLEMSRQGLAAIYFGRFFAKLYNESLSPEYHLHPLESANLLHQSEPSEVYLVKRRSDPETPAFKKLARAVRNALGSEF